MYPHQRTPMGKPYIVSICGLESPRIPREHNKYHGYTVRGTPNGPLRKNAPKLKFWFYSEFILGCLLLVVTFTLLEPKALKMHVRS